LLAFSRKQVLEPKIVDLNAKLSEMADMLSRIVGEDVVFSLRLAPGLGCARLDPTQVEQIVVNLVVNARDAMPQGGKIVIETQNTSLDDGYAQAHSPMIAGNYVMMAVSDSGIGMDSATQRHVFEPFFTTKPSGTGLGLATVYGAVKQSGGHIWLYSEPGKGTIFKIYFPRVDEPSDSVKAPPSKENKSSASETVLLVEDSDSLRDVTKEFLGMAGYSVCDFGNGSEALSFAREHNGPIHLLLTDVVMPGMSGRELARDLVHLHPETRVLFISGYSANAIHHQGVLDDDVNLLPKPFTRSSLMQKVRELLDSGR
jgi:CheY-like chemotaxis protein